MEGKNGSMGPSQGDVIALAAAEKRGTEGLFLEEAPKFSLHTHWQHRLLLQAWEGCLGSLLCGMSGPVLTTVTLAMGKFILSPITDLTNSQ